MKLAWKIGRFEGTSLQLFVAKHHSDLDALGVKGK